AKEGAQISARRLAAGRAEAPSGAPAEGAEVRPSAGRLAAGRAEGAEVVQPSALRLGEAVGPSADREAEAAGQPAAGSAVRRDPLRRAADLFVARARPEVVQAAELRPLAAAVQAGGQSRPAAGRVGALPRPAAVAVAAAD